MNFLVHLFLPHQSNNHRPKILHHQSLLFIVIGFVILQTLLFLIKTVSPQILGIATDIRIDILLEKTNEERQKHGSSQLVLNQELSQAAYKKAQDMFSRDYWAHNSPDGTTPWIFIKESRYEYTFAGENLAKDFLKSGDVVNAWMASPKHRENILSQNFEDVGFAILDGKLSGKETTLVVQMFGKKSPTVLTRNPQPRNNNLENISSGQNTAQGTNVSPIVFGLKRQALLDANQTSKSLAVGVLSLLIGVLSIDMIFIERKKIVRLVGHNFDHILFLAGPLLISVFNTRGSIL